MGATMVVSGAPRPLTQYPVVPGPEAVSSPSPGPERFLLPRNSNHSLSAAFCSVATAAAAPSIAPHLSSSRAFLGFHRRLVCRRRVGRRGPTREPGDSNDSSSGGTATHLSGVTVVGPSCASRLPACLQ